jgi:penicillin-binding protein 2
LAWFAGFLPADNPRFAYAALYEGKPHQRISGGRMAATIVKSFFESIKPDMEQALKAPTRALDGSTTEAPMTEEERFAAEAEAAANAQRKADEARRRQEAERRHRQSGWDDGRSRH